MIPSNEDPAHKESPDNTQTPHTGDLFGVALAVLWLAVPALQYLGTYQRTDNQVHLLFPDSALATLDLTSWYVVLLCSTALYAGFRRLRRRERLRV